MFIVKKLTSAALCTKNSRNLFTDPHDVKILSELIKVSSSLKIIIPTRQTQYALAIKRPPKNKLLLCLRTLYYSYLKIRSNKECRDNYVHKQRQETRHGATITSINGGKKQQMARRLHE